MNPASTASTTAPAGHRAALASQLRLLARGLLLGVVYVVLSTPAAYTSSAHTLAAIIWPAPAVAAALLWRTPYGQWPVFLMAIFAAMLVVGNADPLPLGADIAFAVLNVLEVALYAFIGRRYVSPAGDIDTSNKLTRYLVLLPLLCTAAVATMGASIGMLTKGTAWLDEWRVMLVGNGLAVLILLPGLLAWLPANAQAPQQEAAEQPHRAPAVTAGLITALMLLSAIMPIPPEVLRALLSFVLVWAALYGGLRAASSGVLAAAFFGIGMTMMHRGPYGLMTDQEGVWTLQLDLATMAVLSFFVAIAVFEKRKLNSRLDRARRFESMGLLAGGIAHDFNNILGAVGGYAELASEQLIANSPASGSLREVALAVSRGRDLTEQILLAGRQGERARGTLDLRDVVVRAAALAHPLLPTGIEMTVSIPATAVLVSAHEGQLVRALLNLLRNAAQAATSRVAVTLLEAPEHVSAVAGADLLVGETLTTRHTSLDVTDDGPGIAPLHLQQLFDPFFSTRAAGTRGGSGHRNGTGLGLAIVAGVVADHAGGVAVWTGHGAATRFRLMLPIVTQASAPPSPAQASSAAPLGNGQPVLVVEKNDAMRERYEDWLAALGFEPVGHASADSAMVELEQSPGAFVLLVLGAGNNGNNGDSGDNGDSEAVMARARTAAPALALINCQDADSMSGIVQGAGCVRLPAMCDLSSFSKAVTMAHWHSPASSNPFPLAPRL